MPEQPEFATEIQWDREAVAAAVDEMRDVSDTWRIKWGDGRSRTTSLVGLAWYARVSDPEASVIPV